MAGRPRCHRAKLISPGAIAIRFAGSLMSLRQILARPKRRFGSSRRLLLNQPEQAEEVFLSLQDRLKKAFVPEPNCRRF